MSVKQVKYFAKAIEVCLHFCIVVSVNFTVFQNIYSCDILLTYCAMFFHKNSLYVTCPDYPSDFPTRAYCACAHPYRVLILTLNNNISFICITVRVCFGSVQTLIKHNLIGRKNMYCWYPVAISLLATTANITHN